MAKIESTKETGFQFRLQVSVQYEKSLNKIREAQLRKKANECVTLLARGFPEWKRLHAKKIDVGDSSKCIRSIRVNENMRIIFEGPIRYKSDLLLFVHDICPHDEYLRKLRSLARTSQKPDEVF
jgi:DUF1009 family protein